MIANHQTTISNWDQRETLEPPHLESWARIRRGLNTGDPSYSKVPGSLLRCHGNLKLEELPQPPVPHWVNWEQVSRGQNILKRQYIRYILSLALALGLGFPISRFSDLLDASGYSSSPRTAAIRYAGTLIAITKWIYFPLDQVNSPARTSLTFVRSLHELARRSGNHLFDQTMGEGIALSQYDLSVTLIAFSGISLQVAQDAFGVEWKAKDIDEVNHFWRTVGYYLGIQDEFNVCNDVQEMMQCTSSLRDSLFTMMKTSRPSADRLVEAAYTGFGELVGCGPTLCFGALRETIYKLYGVRVLRHAELYQDCQSIHLLYRPEDKVAFAIVGILMSSPVQFLFSRIVIHFVLNILETSSKVRRTYRSHRKLSKFMEAWLWPTIRSSMLFFITLAWWYNWLMHKHVRLAIRRL